MKKELKLMFESMQENLLDAEMLCVRGGDVKPCAEKCQEGCSDGCQAKCSKACPVMSAARR